MPTRYLAAVYPVVLHAYLEHLSGLPVHHVLWEAALGGLFVGAGLPPRAAIAALERVEELTGLGALHLEHPRYHQVEWAALRAGLIHPLEAAPGAAAALPALTGRWAPAAWPTPAWAPVPWAPAPAWAPAAWDG